MSEIVASDVADALEALGRLSWNEESWLLNAHTSLRSGYPYAPDLRSQQHAISLGLFAVRVNNGFLEAGLTPKGLIAYNHLGEVGYEDRVRRRLNLLEHYTKVWLYQQCQRAAEGEPLFPGESDDTFDAQFHGVLHIDAGGGLDIPETVLKIVYFENFFAGLVQPAKAPRSPRAQRVHLVQVWSKRRFDPVRQDAPWKQRMANYLNTILSRLQDRLAPLGEDLPECELEHAEAIMQVARYAHTFDRINLLFPCPNKPYTS